MTDQPQSLTPENHDEEDVKSLLERETFDGPGDANPDELTDGDFEGEAAEDYVDLQPNTDTEENS